MPIAGADGDPLPMTPPPIAEEAPRRHLVFEQASIPENVGCRPGTIIAAVI